MNTRLRNSIGGRIGSAARRSTKVRATRQPTPTTPISTISGEAQSYVLPPSDVSRMIPLSPAASRAVPA